LRVPSKSLPRVEDAAHRLLAESLHAARETPPLQPLEPDYAVRCAAVDGGHSVVSDFGSCGVIAVRAGYTVRSETDDYEDVVPYNDVHVVPRSEADRVWHQLTQGHDWGHDLSPPRATGAQWVRAWCEAYRAAAEHDAARRALRVLHRGQILLLDGSLDPDPAHPSVVEGLLRIARREGIHVVGVTKDTTLSFAGMLPFTLELEAYAAESAAPARFWAEAGPPLGRHDPFSLYGARFDARSPVYRVDVAAADDEPAQVLRSVAALCNDVTTPGYPYPLARIHDRVHFASHESGDLRRALEAMVAQRRGSLFSLRMFGRGRDVLRLA
jgi:hypothetical protein